MSTFKTKHATKDAKAAVEAYQDIVEENLSNLESVLELAISGNRDITNDQLDELESLIIKAIHLTKIKIPEILEISDSEWSESHVAQFMEEYLKILQLVIEEHNEAHYKIKMR